MVAVISLRRVARTYPGPPAVAALRSVDLRVAPGEYVAVIGPSGSGKSTFLNILGLLDRPTEGVYELDGLDVQALSPKLRSQVRGQRIGFVFQSFHLLPHRTAIENVALAQLYHGVARAKRISAAEQALQRVGLCHRMNALPSTMSGGERQRVAIARAVMHRPSLLLCDEPTGNLDTATTADILGLLDELHGGGMTIVVITHDPNVATRAQRLVSIRDGVLYE